MEYIAFTDESSITASRFCSLTSVSFPLRYYETFNDRLDEILRVSGVTEFGWAKLRNKKYFCCAEKLLTLIVENHEKYNLRVDVLVWDTHDSRHTVIGRDDMANYERMFFHLLNTSMKRRGRKSVWYIYPDERNGIDWKTIAECLLYVGKTREYRKTLFGGFFSHPFFTIKAFEEKDSAKEPVIQLADLFSGLTIFSREKYPEFQIWQEKNDPQIKLFGGRAQRKLSNSEKFRSRLLYSFNTMCKCHRLGVSLQTEGRLKTFSACGPFNFWHYEPQGDYDTAPVRP